LRGDELFTVITVLVFFFETGSNISETIQNRETFYEN